MNDMKCPFCGGPVKETKMNTKHAKKHGGGITLYQKRGKKPRETRILCVNQQNRGCAMFGMLG